MDNFNQFQINLVENFISVVSHIKLFKSSKHLID
jgi:hypothetical protein